MAEPGEAEAPAQRRHTHRNIAEKSKILGGFRAAHLLSKRTSSEHFLAFT